VIHLTLNQISAYIDAELPEASVELVRLHLSSCLECTERFGLIEEQEEALARLLVNDPGEAFFSAFNERVLGPAPVPAPAPKREVPPPKRDAAVPSAEARRPAPDLPATARPSRRTRAPRFLFPAAALLLVGSAVAVIVTRPDLAGLPAGGARPPSPPEGGDRSPGVSAAPAVPPPDAAPPPASGAPSRLERAAARSADADRACTAEGHDAAAQAWEDALPELESNPDELAAGRREIASARYRAWAEEGTPMRREAATRAVRAYLLSAPAGSERDSAWAWLARLKR
jgi:hypothetical protein